MKKLRISIYLLVLTFSCLEIDGNTAVQSGMNIYEKGIFPLEEQQLANSASGMPDAINNDRNIFENSSASVIQFDPPRESSSNIYNEVAQQLAGLYIPDARRDNSIYIDYARFIGAEWKNLSEVSLSKIEDWSNTNIVPHLKNSETLFYPFGGPDIAYALKFFPGMQNYILIGLEPIGNFESIQKSIGNESAILALKQAFSQY
ncbi:MAG: hypothetical protein LBQ08_00350, partial [Holosporaceae bacterium]|nr:hypothetical protein [Holosporaceae bacterium]